MLVIANYTENIALTDPPHQDYFHTSSTSTDRRYFQENPVGA